MRRRIASQLTTLHARARQAMHAAANQKSHPNVLGLVEAELIKLSEDDAAAAAVADDGGTTKDFEGKACTFSRDAIVMPKVDGGDLHDYSSSFPFTSRTLLPFARGFFAQMVAGARHLHDLGIVHLDLKLENMLLDQKFDFKRAKLMINDFGLARRVPATGDNAGRLECRFTGGDKRYAPPETILWRNPDFADAKTDGFKVDVWCLGVCLSTLLFGAVFDDENHTLLKKELFTQMRDAQLGRGRNFENGLRYVCSVSKETWETDDKMGRDSAVRRFDSLSEALKQLLDGMLRVRPEERPTLDVVATSPWVAPRRGAAPPPATPRTGYTSLSAAADASMGTEYRGMSAAADEEEEPRYNACSALPDSAALEEVWLGAETWMPRIGRGAHVEIL